MGMQEKLQELRNGFETAYIDKTSTSNLAYKPQFISNDYKQGKKVLSSIEDELMTCDQFSDQCCIYYNGRNYTLIADFAGAGRERDKR